LVGMLLYSEWWSYLAGLYTLLIYRFQCYDWSEVDWYGAYTSYVWSKTFSLMHLKAKGNLVARLGWDDVASGAVS
jgi:hypothetical protein